MEIVKSIINDLSENDIVTFIITLCGCYFGKFILSGDRISIINNKIFLYITDDSELYIPLKDSDIEYCDETESFDIIFGNNTVNMIL